MIFLRHEIRLAWRDLFSMLTGGRRRKPWRVLLGFALFVVFMHWLCAMLLQQGTQPRQDMDMYVTVGSTMLLSFMLMLSQAMESITRNFYTRGDLDVILSAPRGARFILALRLSIQAVMVSFMSVALIGPMLNVLAYTDSPRWLAGYGMALVMGFIATALGVLLVVALFHLVGQKRTRFIAQILAAIIGAAFVIILQIAAIEQTGSIARMSFLHSPAVMASLPPLASSWWLPVKAAMGNGTALCLLMGGSLLFYALVLWPLVTRFAYYSAQAASMPTIRSQRAVPFRSKTARQALRRKEWLLMIRDPWLASQTLMQLLYLLPPALILWHSLDSKADALLVVIPVLVMAAGQLAGGLAWITLSGEDAPDLLATSPHPARSHTFAKLETVALIMAALFSPFLLALLYASPWMGLVCLIGGMLAAGSSIAIQFWFRTAAGRSQFRRRHTASRIATFSEALCCVCWAGASALLAMQTAFAAVFAVLSLLILLVAYSQRSQRTA